MGRGGKHGRIKSDYPSYARADGEALTSDRVPRQQNQCLTPAMSEARLGLLLSFCPDRLTGGTPNPHKPRPTVVRSSGFSQCWARPRAKMSRLIRWAINSLPLRGWVPPPGHQPDEPAATVNPFQMQPTDAGDPELHLCRVGEPASERRSLSARA